MNLKKWLLYSFTPVLAASMMSGVALASHHKKKKDAKATTTQTQTAPATNSSSAQKSTMSSSSNASTSKMSRSRVASQTPSAGEISNAKAKGLVWVNTGSKVYHTGGRYYGKTKHGQFMTRADAQKAGYRQARN